MNEKYWNDVISNMTKNDYVQFGITGTGVHPNYQITSEKDEIRTFTGKNHEEVVWEKYAEENITKKYSLSEVGNQKIRDQILELIQS